MTKDDSLRLEVCDFADPYRWRWRLTDSAGKFLADHAVSLDQSDVLYPAFLDLEGHLKQFAAPDKWPEDEVRLIEEVGEWIGRNVFGPVGRHIVGHDTPVTVRVIAPQEAAELLHRPLELAHVNGQPLCLQDVSLVLEVTENAPAVRKEPVGDPLRMLAVFSLPTDASVLALRRERYELERLIRRICQTHGVAIDLRVLQYGVTREALQETLEEGEGWDVMHFSGHGLHAGLLLEKADGTNDLITTRDLQELLKPARSRLKLVTLSSCLSAATTVEETLRWLGIRPQAALASGDVEMPAAGHRPLPAVARGLVERLDCAAVAMRYPVGDDFAIELAAELYEGMLGQGQPLTRALQLALPKALGKRPHPGVPPLSVATPAIFGRQAAALSLKAPASPPRSFVVSAGLAHFPDEPRRFVGRVGPMTRASAAMAPETGKAGVLFYGMAGSGKTACAVELAYRYRARRFEAFVWHKVPDERSDIEGALTSFALDMEKQLEKFSMVHVVDRAEDLRAWLPRLTELLEQHSILIVLDNLESLLTEDGKWRDERWGMLVQALLSHQGLSRTVLTSRRRPVGLGNETRLLIEPIHALSLSEAALLARELPNLGKLLRGDEAAGLARGRQLVSRTLAVVQGHPKLIEFAEGQAGEPEALERHLKRAEAAWEGRERRLEAFFQEGQSALGADDFLNALAGWTRAVSAALPEASRTLFHFLCCLEEGDRQSGILEANWGDLWRRLGLPGEPPEPEATLGPLAAGGVVEVESAEADRALFRLHPGVAEAGQEEAGDEFRAAVDAELAAFWRAAFARGRKEETRGAGGLVVLAGRRAAPYLLRRRRWQEASTLLEQAVSRDKSPGTLAAVLPLLRHIAQATREEKDGLKSAGVLASALLDLGRWREAEDIQRRIIQQTAERGELRTASAVTGHLINLLAATGRAGEALALVEEKRSYTRRAGLGPWTQLGDEGWRLQLLNALGRCEEALAEVERLREQMLSLPEESDREEAVVPWNVREVMLDTGRSAALGLDRWEMALELNAEIVRITEARGATALEVARTRFNNHGPLLRLRRYDEARALLYLCREVFQAAGAVNELGHVFSALADLEDEVQRPAQAQAFEETALRYTYSAGTPEDCSISHFNLANYLMRTGAPPEAALAHRLAAGVIDFQSNSGQWLSTRPALARHLAMLGDEPPLPASFNELCLRVEQMEGVRFRELFEHLPRRAADGDEALREVIRLAREPKGGLRG